MEPRAADRLESYFKFGGFIGGGPGNQQALSSEPMMAEAELNEWRILPAGHYRVFAISNRAWRAPDPGEKTPYGRVSEMVRSKSWSLT